jgi:serine/threonine protein kinase
MVNGKLQSSSIDVYLALEHCATDLHALQGQMEPAMVKQLMQQLISGVQYLHELQVWHRDLKSANLLMKMHEGVQTVKIADLGMLAACVSRHRPEYTGSSYAWQCSTSVMCVSVMLASGLRACCVLCPSNAMDKTLRGVSRECT